MDDKISFLRKIGLALDPASAETDAEIRRVVGDRMPSDSTMAVLRDLFEGAKERQRHVNPEELGFRDLLDIAAKNRLSLSIPNERGRVFTPTGADYFELLNPDLVVPQRAAMPNLWENDVPTYGLGFGA